MEEGFRTPGTKYRVRHASGEWRWYTARVNTVRDEKGNFLNVTGVAQDITRRRQAEEALRESEGKYRLIAENVTDIIAVLDMNLRFTYVSPSIMRIRGFTVEEAIEQTPDQFLTPESLKMVLTAYEEEMKLEAGGTADPDRIRTMEVEEYRKNGSVIWMEVSLSFLRDGSQKAVGIVSVSRDITERKKAEEDIKKAEEKYRSIFENAIEGIFQTTPDGRYLAANTAQAHMLGYNSPEELIKAVNDISTQVYVKKESRDYFLRILEERGFIRGYETKFFRKDGSTIWVSSNARVICDENGKTVYYEGFNADITERKQAAEELRIYQKELQALAIKMTEVEETERKEIARTLHDLVGQNLTALNLNLNIILEMMTEDQKSPLFTRLEDSQKLLEETTQYIREVMSDLRPSVLDDFGLLAALHWYGQRFQGRTGIQTKVEGEEFSPRFHPTMETIIFRIAQEALANVLKHASAREVNLRLEKVEDRVRLTITDDGQGFSFKGFRFGGEKRGWGIATMKERAVALRGDLQILTEPGKGTRVILQLPVEG
jgi:two-component system sensor histidine kinase UhpB